MRLGFEDKMADDVKRYSLDSWFNSNMAAGTYMYTHNCVKWPADNDFYSHSNIYMYTRVCTLYLCISYTCTYMYIRVYNLGCCARQFLTLGLLRPQMCIVHLICYAHVHVFIAQRKAMQPSLRNSLKDYETKIRQGEESLHENRVMGNQDEVFFVYFLNFYYFFKKYVRIA